MAIFNSYVSLLEGIFGQDDDLATDLGAHEFQACRHIENADKKIMFYPW